MIKVYDENKTFLKMLDATLRNFSVREELRLGYKVLSFEVPCTEEYLMLFNEEGYIETKDYSYIIKGLNLVQNDFFEVVAYPNLEGIIGLLFDAYDVLDKNPQQAYTYTLAQTDWTVDYRSSINTIMTLQTANVDAMEMLRAIASLNNQELWFDTKNQKLVVYDSMGTVFGAYYSNELRMRQARQDSNTYDFATVLIPIGKDGLRITDINNGKDFIEDYTYSNKHIQDYFFDESCEVAEILKSEAEQELVRRAHPQASYELAVAEVGDDIQLGDTITIVDKLKRIKTKQRVVAITRYPFEPERGTIEIDNLKSDFIREFIDVKKETNAALKNIRKQIVAVS